MSRLIVNGELLLYGFVGTLPDGFFVAEGFTATEVIQALAQLSGDVTVRVNSPGGIASDGIAIYNALRERAAGGDKITVKVDGIAASTGSIITMAGDTIVVPASARLMIHCAATFTWGTGIDHRKTADALDKLDQQVADIYAARSGRSADEMRALMAAETWFTGTEAVEAGLATEVTADKAAEPVAFNYALYAHAPERLKQVAAMRVSLPSLRRGPTAAVAAPNQEAAMPNETLTGRLRWWSTAGGSNVLQQEWSITSGEGDAETTAIEWRDVPVEADTASPPALDSTMTAATAERNRILGIEKVALPGHEQLVAEMKADGKTTPDQAAARLIAAEKAMSGQHLAAIRDVENAAAGVQAAPRSGDGKTPPAESPEKAAAALAAKAVAYRAEQAKLGIPVTAAEAVKHVSAAG